MNWVKEKLDYWKNPKCPKEYLEGALVRLINEVEGAKLPINHFENLNEKELREEVKFYEYVSDK